MLVVYEVLSHGCNNSSYGGSFRCGMRWYGFLRQWCRRLYLCTELSYLLFEKREVGVFAEFLAELEVFLFYQQNCAPMGGVSVVSVPAGRGEN